MLESVDKYKSPSLYFPQVSFQIQIGSSDMNVCINCEEYLDNHCLYCGACPEQDCCEQDDLLLDN